MRTWTGNSITHPIRMRLIKGIGQLSGKREQNRSAMVRNIMAAMMFLQKITPFFLNATLWTKVEIVKCPHGYYNKHVFRNQYKKVQRQLLMTQIELIADGKRYDGVLNETIAAKDFIKRLPFTATCRKNETEYYCSSANGVFEPLDLQLGYHAGDIIQWDGWFFVAYQDADEESAKQHHMVIGRLAGYESLMTKSDSIKIIMKKQEV